MGPVWIVALADVPGELGDPLTELAAVRSYVGADVLGDICEQGRDTNIRGGGRLSRVLCVNEILGGDGERTESHCGLIPGFSAQRFDGMSEGFIRSTLRGYHDRFFEPFVCRARADANPLEPAIETMERIAGNGAIGGQGHAGCPRHEKDGHRHCRQTRGETALGRHPLSLESGDGCGSGLRHFHG